MESAAEWYKVSDNPIDGRINVRVKSRYLTIYNHRGKLSCIDAICHHAGGNLGDGELKDIEDLDCTVVLCPLHRYMVDISDGFKVFEGLEDLGDGKLGNPTMKKGKQVQMTHSVRQDDAGVYVSLNAEAMADEDECSRKMYTSDICGQNLNLHPKSCRK